MTLNDLFPNIYFINLAHRTDRLSDCLQEFKSLKIQAQRFEGIISVKKGKGFNAYSFIELIKKAKAENMPNIVIFEDDFLPINKSDFYPALIEFEKFSRKNDWHMFYLGYNCHQKLPILSKHICKIYDCFALHATIWNHTVYDYIIEAEKIIDDNFIIDVFIRDHIQPMNKCYGAVPLLATQRKSFSDIEGKTVDYFFIEDRFKQFVKK